MLSGGSIYDCWRLIYYKLNDQHTVYQLSLFLFTHIYHWRDHWKRSSKFTIRNHAKKVFYPYFSIDALHYHWPDSIQIVAEFSLAFILLISLSHQKPLSHFSWLVSRKYFAGSFSYLEKEIQIFFRLESYIFWSYLVAIVTACICLNFFSSQQIHHYIHKLSWRK